MSKVSFTDAVATKLATLREGNAISIGLITKLAKSIAARGKAMDIDMHTCALAALEASDTHGDANSMALLLNSMPKGSRALTLAQWAEFYGNVRVSKDKQGKFKCNMVKAEDRQVVDFKAAAANPFWVKAEVVTGVFNDAALLKAVDALIKRAEKDNAELSADAKARIADLRVVSAKLTPADAKVSANA